MSDEPKMPPTYCCIRCNEDRTGAPRLKTIAGPVCDACEWLQEMRESEGPHDPQWERQRRTPK